MGDEELEAVAGRVELLMQHLVGPGLGRRVDRADLVQETMLRLLRSDVTAERAEEGPDALWAHARTMARRVVVDAARAARHRPRRMSSLVPETASGDSSCADGVHRYSKEARPGPRTLAAHAESAAQWLEGFRRLSPEHRRVLGLRRFEGLSAADTAARMGRSETAVHSLFRRALAAWEEASSTLGP